MASTAAEAFRARQQSNVDASFSAQINSTTSSYDSQIASCKNKRSNMVYNLTPIDVTNNFLNSDEGKKLIVYYADRLPKNGSIPSPGNYINNNFFGPFDPSKNNNLTIYHNHGLIPNNQQIFNDFIKKYTDYVKKSNIPEAQKFQLLSLPNLFAAADLYRSSINETVNLKKLTKCWDGNGRMYERVMPTESDALAAIKKIVENKKLNIFNEINALECKIKNLEKNKNDELSILSAQYANVLRMLNDENYINQYEALVLNNKYAIQTFTESNRNPELFDLRNVCGLNFRGFSDEVAKRNKEINSNEFFLKNTGRQMPVSRTFIMNKDYLITDTLALKSYDDLKNSVINEVISGWHENLKNKIEIQPLILNEFQPYDVITPGDLIPGVINTLIKGGQDIGGEAVGVGVSIGRHFLMKKQIESIAANPSQLYNTSHTKEGNSIDLLTNVRDRRYFTEDPVQVVQNMFNGGKWLNTFHIPYYGGDYLMSNFSGNWNTTGSEAFYGTAIAGDGGKAGEISLKRIWY